MDFNSAEFEHFFNYCTENEVFSGNFFEFHVAYITMEVGRRKFGDEFLWWLRNFGKVSEKYRMLHVNK